MALITCTECGKEFSDKASACPNCGCPTSEIISQNNKKEELLDIVIDSKNYEPNEKTINAAIERGIVEKADDIIISCGNYSDGKFFSLSNILYVAKDKFYLCKFDHVKKIPDIIIPLEYKEESIEKFRYNIHKNSFEADRKVFEFNPKDIYDKKERLMTAYFEILKRIDAEKAKFFYDIKFLNKMYCPKCNGFNIEITMQSTEMESKGNSEIRKKSAVTRAGNSMGRAAMIGMTGGLWALTPKKSKYKETKKSNTKVVNKKFAICQDCGNSWEIN